MKLCIISFTDKGRRLSENIAERLEETEIETELYTKHKFCAKENGKGRHPVLPVEESVGEWAGEHMWKKSALLFTGACGIAVRAVAPHLTDKLHDSPVLVMDENGRYVIPILSGHMGGANELAYCLAEKTGADPVITTATDCNGMFAVDMFARRNGLSIVNKDGIAKVSARILAGETITISTEPEYEASLVWEKNILPEGVDRVSYPPCQRVDVLITSESGMTDAALLLRPREYIIGLGCKKGKSADEIGRFIAGKLKEMNISMAQISALASISRKKEEQGIIEWCRRENLPFLTYTAEELQTAEGDFMESAFVKEQAGVGNVCERAAVLACGPGAKLVCKKYAVNGMTIAVARKKWERKA